MATRSLIPAAGLKQSPQPEKLAEVIRTAQAAMHVAQGGFLYCTEEGLAFVQAVADLTEVDGLYTLADDIAHDCGVGDYEIPTVEPIVIRALI